MLPRFSVMSFTHTHTHTKIYECSFYYYIFFVYSWETPVCNQSEGMQTDATQPTTHKKKLSASLYRLLLSNKRYS